MATGNLLSPTDLQTIALDYLSGESSLQLGRRYGVRGSTIAYHLHRLGIPVRRQVALTSRQQERERYESLVTRSGQGDGCWGWRGSIGHGGYGHFHGIHSTPRSAHRWAYEEFIGTIPEGMQVCHTCDNPPCSNPRHLFLGTVSDNMRDKIAKGRQARGARMGMSKLTDAQVSVISKRVRRGELQAPLAQEFGVSQSTISLIKLRKVWRHVV